jgi:adenylyltransferase/sulfurtransferase
MSDLLTVTDRSRQRYSRLAISNVWKLDALRAARALVVGAGALGNEVGKNLALMGVRLITIVDRDTVEVSNLTRSVFFRESDHGQPKATVLAERLYELNPDVEVLPLVGSVEEVVGLGLVRRSDLVFSCLDNRLARLTLNRMCHKVGKPWVDGAMENLDGEVAVYTPGSGPCYECTLGPVDRTILAQATSCKHVMRRNLAEGKVPTTSTMGSIIAALQVQEAIKVHQGNARDSLAGKKLVINSSRNDFYTTTTDPKDDCPGHITFGDIVEVPEWTRTRTTPRDILARLKEDTGHAGQLRLGMDLVLGIDCPSCRQPTRWERPLRSPIPAPLSLCPACGAESDPVVIHRVSAEEPWADWPLERFAIGNVDVLEARSAGGGRWYEITGDLDVLPAALR